MFRKLKTDIDRYKAYSNRSALVLILSHQGLWAITVYRINSYFYRLKLPKLLKKVILFFSIISQKWIEVITGISIPFSVQVGSGLYIGHTGNIMINSNAIIGNNCNISQGVTIGVSGRGNQRGVPIIGNNVYIGANAVVAGKIIIGDGSVIGANSFVNRDVAPNTTVLGVPAKKISDNDSKDYL